MVVPLVGQSIVGLGVGEAHKGDLGWLIPLHRLTNGPTFGPSVGRTVGDPGRGEIHTESCQKPERR